MMFPQPIGHFRIQLPGKQDEFIGIFSAHSPQIIEFDDISP
jgi:hypothetical protein